MKLSRFPDKQITQQAARTQLASLLSGCTDERLAAFTVGGLARIHRVPEREIEYELTIARQRRANG